MRATAVLFTSWTKQLPKVPKVSAHLLTGPALIRHISRKPPAWASCSTASYVINQASAKPRQLPVVRPSPITKLGQPTESSFHSSSILPLDSTDIPPTRSLPVFRRSLSFGISSALCYLPCLGLLSPIIIISQPTMSSPVESSLSSRSSLASTMRCLGACFCCVGGQIRLFQHDGRAASAQTR